MAKPNYHDLAALSNSSEFQDRCAVAVAVYARYLINEDPATPLHTSRASWAKEAFRSSRSVVGRLAIPMALDSVFADQDPLNFDTTPDTGAGSVQVAVEATINATELKF